MRGSQHTRAQHIGQHRIVAKIDQLMARCDTLDQQIAAIGKQTALLNALMSQI